MNNPTELKTVISQVMNSLIPLAVRRRSFFINEIDTDIKLHADRDMIAYVLGDVLVKAIHHTDNDCIRISADVYSNIVLVKINETSQRPYTTIAVSMEQLQPLAEKLGGSISVNSRPDHGVTVAVTFFNGSRAA
jgi:signal transduction histidine kinase